MALPKEQEESQASTSLLPPGPKQCPLKQGRGDTHGDFRSFGFLPMEAKHNYLQAMAAIRPLKKARLDEVIRIMGREVDASVCQTVAGMVQEPQVDQNTRRLGASGALAS